MSVDGLGRCVMVVPTYNESENLEWIVGRLRAAQPGVDVLVVDDNSPDGTGDLADRLAAADPAVQVVHRTEKAGLGAAYLHGFDVALRAGYDVIGEMDADGSHQPEQLQRLLDALHTADLVIGSRYVPGGSVVNWPVQRLLLSRGGNLYVRLLLGIRVKDATAGYRLFRRTTLEAIDLGAGEVYWIRVPDRPRLPHRAPRPPRDGGADRVHRARARRLQDERAGRERVAAHDHPVGALRASPAASTGQGAGMTAPTPPTGPRRRRRWVRPVLAVAFVVVPLVEIWAILQVGQLVGPWWTIVLLVLDSMLGAWLIKREGGRAWIALREALQSGRMPAREIADGALILIGGTLMLSPGFVLDIAGIVLILPFTRPVARRLLTKVVERRLVVAPTFGTPFGRPGGARGSGRASDPVSVPETTNAPDRGPEARWSGATSSRLDAAPAAHQPVS